MAQLNLGKTESVHGISPVFLQRAAIVCILSFVFFLVMISGFYVRQNFVYFLLATSFLIINIFTLSGWLMARKNVLKIYENGISYKKFAATWDEIESINVKKSNGLLGEKMNVEINKTDGEKMVLTEAVHGIENIIERVQTEIR
jgi:hypothetical protein